MKFVEWKTYRTRFLVKAKQLNSALTFVDHLGRQHIGRKGDYLVESSEGVLSIAPRQIFEDIYVSMSEADETQPTEFKTDSRLGEKKHASRELNHLPIEHLDITEVSFSRKPVVNQSNVSTRELRRDEPTRVRRKQPQPCDRRASDQPSRLNLM